MGSPIRRLISAVIVFVFGTLFGCVFLSLGTLELYRMHRLSEAGMTVEARAFDWSTSAEDGPTEYRLHYEFAVAGVTYSSTDATGRSDLWQEVPPEVWMTSQRTGTLSVRYVADDPWINEPAVGVPGATGDHFAGLFLGAMCCLGAVMAPLVALFGRQR